MHFCSCQRRRDGPRFEAATEQHRKQKAGGAGGSDLHQREGSMGCQGQRGLFPASGSAASHWCSGPISDPTELPSLCSHLCPSVLRRVMST